MYDAAMLDSIALYAGGTMALGGALATLRKSTRRRGMTVACGGLAMATMALVWPAREQSVREASSALDRAVPRWQFAETHAIEVAAPPERVYAAMRAVTAGEIPMYQTLTAIRRGLCGDGGESILNAPGGEPLIDVALRGGFRSLADDPPREIVIGMKVAPRVLAAMNFRITPDARGGSRLTTETRVHAGTARARRLFAVYWRIIHPGSDIIRRSWLRAIRRRAERPAGEENAR